MSSNVVPALSAEQELALSAALGKPAFPTVVVVSDLHLGDGREPDGSGRWVPRENFFADDAFGRFLEAQRAQPGPVLLVLNGDAFDFLRVDSAPESDADFERWRAALARFGDGRSAAQLKATVSSVEIDYGLQTNDFKCVWKFLEVARGHANFFAALARWLRAGGTIAWVRGNHDVEQYWPLVRRAFRQELADGGAGVAETTERVVFVDDWVRLENLVVEHGHQYEKMTRVVGGPILTGTEELNLPIGSLVNRYVVNKLENIVPFLDNMKPVSRMVLQAAKRHPMIMFTLLRRGSRLLLRALQRRKLRSLLVAGAIVVVALTQLLPWLAGAALAAWLLVPAVREWIAGSPLSNGTLRTVLTILGFVAPYLLRILEELMGRHKPKFGEDEFADGVYEALPARLPPGAQWPTVYVTIGHTHAEDAQVLPGVAGARRVVYVNSGTWIPRWPDDRPDLLGQVHYTFLRFTLQADGYTHAILRWHDAAAVERDAVISAPR